MSDIPHIRIATLKAMHKQLLEVIENIDDGIDMAENGCGSGIQSLSAMRKAHRDMEIQRDALQWAIDCGVRAYGSPPEVIADATYNVRQ